MENQNFVVNGGMKLPIGFRFRPTDEELVVHYLKRKVFGLPLPASIIPDLDVFHTHPSGFPGDMNEKKRYFFSKIRNGNGNNESKCKVATGSGYWKYVHKNRPVLASATEQVVGIRRSLIFYEGRSAHETKTQWVMHEYRLVGITTNPCSNQLVSNKMVTTGDWVVYSIFQRKKKSIKKGAVSIIITTISSSKKIMQAIDFSNNIEAETDLLGPTTQPASSCSSEITVDELSASSVLDQEESSGYCIRKHMNCRN